LEHARTFKTNVKVTPFMMATCEICCKDRRGVTPQHILYMAMKILPLRVSEGLHATFRCVGDTEYITKRMTEDKEYLVTCIEKNLSFLKSIPNPVQFWQQCKQGMFVMIRQPGKPTMFLTLSTSEVCWSHILQILCKLQGEICVTYPLRELNAIRWSQLVNEDPVTCVIYFNKLVDVIMRVLQHRKIRPFGVHHTVDYFKRIEFQHRGSPMHIC
jgi:hypothetical protein